jgi:hypothetical protein
MRKPFEDLLDEITEARRNAATSNDTRLEPRVAVVSTSAKSICWTM